MKCTFIFWYDDADGEYISARHVFKAGTEYSYVEECYNDWMLSYGFYEDQVNALIENGDAGFYEE